MNWEGAEPLKGYSSLHEVSFFHFFRMKILFDFNLLKESPSCSEATLIFQERDTEEAKPTGNFSITGCTRWEIDTSQYATFNDYLEAMNAKHYKQYCKTENIFNESGAKVMCVEGDWSEYVEDVFQLYEKIAEKHGARLYDKSFFQMISKQNHYKLICAWFQDEMIGMSVVIDNPPLLQAVCGGLDYKHSKQLHAYSKLNYEFIRLAIESKKFTKADNGMTGDEAKKSLGFKPIPTSFAISSPRPFVRGILSFLSTFIKATITSEGKMKLNFTLPGKK